MSSPPQSSSSNNNTNSSRLLSDTEQELLDEYQKLVNNLYEVRGDPSTHAIRANPHHQMSDRIAGLSDIAAGDLMENLRGLERKMGLVSTLLKTSVYRMVLMQELDGEEAERSDNEADESRMIQ